MRISTRVVLQFEDDGTFREVARDSYEYSGPVALAKKGRQQQAQNTQFQQQEANQFGNNANSSYNNANNFYQSELALNPGGMSSPAAAQFSSDLNAINSTYNGLRQNAFATVGQRGFGSAPSGFQQSTLNALNLGQGQAEQSAYNQGLINTQNQRANAAAGESQLYNTSTSGELGNTNAATNSAFDQSRMGSNLGDILSAGSSILGGVTGLSGLFGSGGSNFYSGAGNAPVVPSPTNYNLASAMPTFSTNPVTTGSGAGAY